MSYYFVKLTSDDKALMLDWLNRAHFLEWWGQPDEEWALLEEALETGDAEPFLVYEGENAIAYIQYWPVKNARGAVALNEELWLQTLKDDTIGVDISLGDEARLAQGLGRKILRQFVNDLRERGYHDIIIDPDIRNLRAIRAYRGAGFERIGQYPALEDGGFGGTLLMKFMP